MRGKKGRYMRYGSKGRRREGTRGMGVGGKKGRYMRDGSEGGRREGTRGMGMKGGR